MGEFVIALERFHATTEAQIEQVTRKIALSVYRRIIMRTPVKTGRARGNWMCTIGSPAETTPGLAAVNDGDKSGRSTIAAMIETVGEWKPIEGQSIFLMNNLPYIDRLEHGSSRQAPAGMVAVTIAEFGGIAQDEAAHSQMGDWGGSMSGSGIGSNWDIGGAGE